MIEDLGKTALTTTTQAPEQNSDLIASQAPENQASATAIQKPSEIAAQQPPKVSRRLFLKLLGGAVTAATFATPGASSLIKAEELQLATLEKLANPEKLQMLSHVGFIDFAPSRPTLGVEPTQYPNTDQLARAILKDEYVPIAQLIRPAIQSLFTGERLRKKVLTNHTRYALVKGGLDTFSIHGQIVVARHQAVLEQYGFSTPGVIFPIQEAFHPELCNPKYQDQLGNKGVELYVSGDKLIELLKKQPSLPKVINLSFQLGEIKMLYLEKYYEPEFIEYEALPRADFTYYYDPRKYSWSFCDSEAEQQEKCINDKATGREVSLDNFPSLTKEEYDKYYAFKDRRYKRFGEYSSTLNEIDKIEIIGSYQGENGKSSFSELLKVALTFPEQLFVCAAGNFGDDLRSIRDQLSHTWPENLVIVGQWSSEQNSPTQNGRQVHGADMYLDNALLGLDDGSSLGTATISAIANMCCEMGMTFTEIKAWLQQASFPQKYLVKPDMPHDQPTETTIVTTLQPAETAEAQVLDVGLLDQLLRAELGHHELAQNSRQHQDPSKTATGSSRELSEELTQQLNEFFSKPSE